ncbi:T9SS type A sorting domain-containing protein [Chryseobacterium ginsenosidimutans]|uniref:T9SS type A sorting domain-containing protein n=1 Tax=Chryseobacterium ginsenosidimutans TaxID=687846 RepID=UPI0027BA1231|nr:T9SS type A sorting domain-containing protein [Chryseobacterium ginsenosidimutans]
MEHTYIVRHTLIVAKFECFNCPPGGGTSSKKADIDVATALAPNPTKSSTDLFYVAADNETISVSITNIYGKVIRTYRNTLTLGKTRYLSTLKTNQPELILLRGSPALERMES